MSDPRLDDPLIQQEPDGGEMWAWIAGLAICALIALVLVAGWYGVEDIKQQASPPIDLGTCSKTEAGDPNGSRVLLACTSGKQFTYTTRK